MQRMQGDDGGVIAKTHMLRVFVDESGNFGDSASVIIDEGRRISDPERQSIARKLNTGETIFVNDLATASISVMHPQGEIDFAGVGVLATAWLLAQLRGKPITKLQGRAGEITTWREDELTWVRANLATMPPWNFQQLVTAETVDAIDLEETKSIEHTMMWAWIDETKGLIRARTFASDWDIPEVEGNGSGSMVLAAQLDRSIVITHGEGSVIYTNPAPDNCADIGGRVMEDKS
jgi:predicted PhzF superfamily epimerase YddE/YHI9